ncbi:leucine-rich repeats and immunoglobulin-like domains protein 2 [Mizuhopecten yessoensis]|nr:leucine-rich repeats and immunoglobulin-like domains protein 2 [Mizuhopecten yessoensis]
MPKTNMAAVLLYFAFTAFVLEGLLLHNVAGENHMCASACSCLLNLVDCSKLGLIEVPRDLPVFVTRLELQFNGISSITADDFRGLNNLTQLDLSNNEIRFLNESVFLHLPALKQLKINHNKLTEVPMLKGLTSLTTLELNHNRIHTLAMELTTHMAQLKVLELSHNQIVDIVPGVFPVNNTLQKLTLNGNGLETFESGCFDNLTSLEVLKMNKNRIRFLPKNLFSKMNKLKTLEITKNQLRQIEGLLFQQLSNLQTLKLRKNQISVLMDGAFYGLTKIQSLQLDHNNISNVTQSWLYRMESLKQLSLTNNRIQIIDPESLEVCKNLQLLDLTNNRLTSITRGSFSELNNLRSLYLSDNHISNIEDGAFRDLQSLELLELNNNAISWTIEDMNGAFTGLTALTKLGLENNKIKSIAQNAFSGLSQVVRLNLLNNPITSIQRDALRVMTQLSQLSFNSSSLLCDCQLSWLPQWLEEKGFQSTVTAVCAHPAKHRGKNIYTIDPQEFKCEGDFLQPVITVSPVSQIALKGQNITLNCSANSTMQSHTQFSWKKNNMLLMDKNVENFVRADGDIYNYTSHLHLTRIQDSDMGLYQCIISNEFGSAYSNKSDIRVHVFPKFVKTPIDVTVKAGHTARLQCAATGQPNPIIKWNKDGDDFPAARERRVHVMTADDVFFIVEVNRKDEGVYSCTAKNAAGMISANATLRVLESPTFVKPMETMKVTSVGDTAVLECMAAGSPAPSLSWLKNDQPLKESQRYFFTAGNQLLIIVQTERSDHGSYTCVMSNTLGKETGSTNLRVIPKNRGAVTEVKGGQQGNNGPSDESTTTGIIIIAVVCCVVGTSLVWVIIIYQTRKRHEMYSATPTDETTLPGEIPSSGYTSSEKEGSFTQPVPMTTPNFQYHDYQMKESGYESSSGRFRAARAAIFPSDVDEEDHQQSVPLTLGEHQLGSDSPENSVSSLHYPNSDETDSLKSSHSTNSTRASDQHTLRTFHPVPTNHDTLSSSRVSANVDASGGGYCEGCDQCQGLTSGERQNCHSANYRHSLYNSPQQSGMPIHHGSQPQPPGASHPGIDYQVEDAVCDSQHNVCNCRCTSPVHNNSPIPVPSNSTVCHHVMKSPSPTPPHHGVPPHVVPNIPNPYSHQNPSLLNTHDCQVCANNKPSLSRNVAKDSNHHNNYKEVLVVGGTHRTSSGAIDKIPPVIPPKHRRSQSSSHSKANGVTQNGTLKSLDGKTVDV